MKKILCLVLSLFLISLLIGCAPVECSADEDCVKAACCHAKDAVSKENAPDCAGVLCTMDCVPETTDCGQGEIKCIEGSCEAVINK